MKKLNLPIWLIVSEHVNFYFTEFQILFIFFQIFVYKTTFDWCGTFILYLKFLLFSYNFYNIS